MKIAEQWLEEWDRTIPPAMHAPLLKLIQAVQKDAVDSTYGPPEKEQDAPDPDWEHER